MGPRLNNSLCKQREILGILYFRRFFAVKLVVNCGVDNWHRGTGEFASGKFSQLICYKFNLKYFLGPCDHGTTFEQFPLQAEGDFGDFVFPAIFRRIVVKDFVHFVDPGYELRKNFVKKIIFNTCFGPCTNMNPKHLTVSENDLCEVDKRNRVFRSWEPWFRLNPAVYRRQEPSQLHFGENSKCEWIS